MLTQQDTEHNVPCLNISVRISRRRRLRPEHSSHSLVVVPAPHRNYYKNELLRISSHPYVIATEPEWHVVSAGARHFLDLELKTCPRTPLQGKDASGAADIPGEPEVAEHAPERQHAKTCQYFFSLRVWAKSVTGKACPPWVSENPRWSPASRARESAFGAARADPRRRPLRPRWGRTPTKNLTIRYSGVVEILKTVQSVSCTGWL